jgi:hypothetical protein
MDLIIIVITLISFFYFGNKYIICRIKNIEGSKNIYTELRHRAAGIKSDNAFSKYSTSELKILRGQLQDIAYKKHLRHKLLPEEKEAICQYPNTYEITKKSVKSKFSRK